MFKLNFISTLIFIATVLNIFSASVSWQRRGARSGPYFAFAVLFLAFWTFCAALDYAATLLPVKVFFAQLEFVGYFGALTLMAAFAVSYAGHEDWLKKAWVSTFFIFIPISNTLLAWTNGLHHLFWTDFVPNAWADNVVSFEHGPAFIWPILTGYLMVAIIAANLIQVALSATEIARKQARVLLLALAIPVVSNLLYLFDVFDTPGVDWSSITFSLAGFLCLEALYGSRLLEIVPVARNILIEQMDDSVLVLDEKGYLADFNQAAQAMFGLQKGDLWRPMQMALVGWPQVVECLSGKPEKKSVEICVQYKAIYLDLRLTPLQDRYGKTFGQLVVIRDITARRRMEDDLRQSEANFREVFDNTAHGIFIVDVLENGNFRMGNSNQAEEIATAIRRESVVGKALGEAFPPKIAGALQANYACAVAAGVPVAYEEDVDLPGIGPQAYYTVLAPVRNEAGRIYRLIGSTLEITARRQMEEALRVSEEKFSKAFHSTPDAAAITRLKDGQILEVNESFSRILGFSRAEALGNSSVSLGIWANLQDRDTFIAALQKNPGVSGMEFDFRTRSGAIVNGLISGSIIYLGGEAHLLVILHDITDWKASEQKYRLLFETMGSGVVYQDAQGQIISANPAAERILGLTLAQMQARTSIDPRWRAIHADGSPFTGETHPAMMALHKGEIVFDVLMGVHNPGADEYRWINVSAVPQFRPGETIPYQVYTTFDDITERRRAELALQAAQERLVAQQRQMAAFEERRRLGRNLHDSVNQSIHSLVLFSETLTTVLEKNNPERVRHIAERLQESARQALKETRLMLYQLRVPDLTEGIDLLAELETRLAMVERRAGLQAKITVDGTLEACPKEWNENLFWITIEALNNAIKHAQAHNMQVNLRCAPPLLVLEVVDDGRGFDPAKPRAGGLGLRNMQERAVLLGGVLDIESTLGAGTCVRLTVKL